MTSKASKQDATEDGVAMNRRQYAAWGLVVQTNRTRAAHVANGLMLLLRLLPEPPRVSGADLDPAAYVKLVKERLKPGLSEPARALCVQSTKHGPMNFFTRADDEERFVRLGREHLERTVEGAERAITPGVHRAFVDTLNADRVVFGSGGSDPTTTGLDFVGFTETHTLRGMHAATYLGLLAATPLGRDALAQFFALAGSSDDPHSRLVRLLGLGVERSWPAQIAPDVLQEAYPLPAGARFKAEAEVTGQLVHNLLLRSARGVTKAETIMAIVDLMLLQLSLLLLRWERDKDAPASGLILALSARQGGRSLHHARARAQESLRHARARIEEQARRGDPLVRETESTTYSPSLHAVNLATAGGWLFPLERRGGSPQYVSPGPRQLVTLVHALVAPGKSLTWAEFSERVERKLGLALGGARDSAATERGLALGSVAEALREASRANEEQALHLGLARRESDNVVIVDGGGEQ